MSGVADGDPDGVPVLAMPFVVTRSAGGPYDDESYAAGAEIGGLYIILGHPLTRAAVDRFERTIRAGNLPQADLCAMRHGWSTTWRPARHGMVVVEFVRAEEFVRPPEGA